MKFRSPIYFCGILIAVFCTDILRATHIYCENLDKTEDNNVVLYHYDNKDEKIGIPWKTLSQKLFKLALDR